MRPLYSLFLWFCYYSHSAGGKQGYKILGVLLDCGIEKDYV